MAFGTDLSNPVRFLGGQSTTDVRNLALQRFGGEVLAAFDLATVFKERVTRKDLPQGAKGWLFPKVWKATAEYHYPGQEMMGNPIQTTQILVTPDDLMVAHTAIADLDEMLSHFDVSSKFSEALGKGIARMFDMNAARQLILSARLAADGPFPAGAGVSADDTLKPTAGVYNGNAWLAAIRKARLAMFNADVPEDSEFTMVVPRGVLDAIKYAVDATGRYIVLDRFLNPSQGGAHEPSSRAEAINYDGVTIIASRNIPNTNETSGVSTDRGSNAAVTVYPKYRADFSKTIGVMWTPDAVASVFMRDVTMESYRDVRRQEQFMVASLLTGLGTLRGEAAYEFSSLT